MLDFPVDFVFPYVTNNDEVWRNNYINFCKENNLDERLKTIDGERFRDFSIIKYLLRSVDLYLPFINNVFIVVSNIEQIPDWIDKTKVKIVLHKDIIPEHFLPMYNSSSIEMFIDNIPDLSEHYIYGNDDFLFLKKLDKEDFFEGDNKIKVNINSVSRAFNTDFTKMSINVYNEVLKITGKSYNSNILLRPEHDFTPMIKSHVKECAKKCEKDILRSLSHFREIYNYNQYLFTLYSYLTGKSVPSKRKFKYQNVSSSNIVGIKNSLYDPNIHTTVLNDAGLEFSKQDVAILNKYLEERFPVKSKYEL